MAPLDSTIWIVHPDPGVRAAIARMAGSVSTCRDAILGRPDDAIFDSAPDPRAIVLGLEPLGSGAGFEDALELARWVSERRPDCIWVLIAEPADHAAVRESFDTLDFELLAHPSDARTLARALRRATGEASPEPLSVRMSRNHLAARFSRWFGRDEPRDLDLALGPQQRDQPLLAVGEPGTGRSLLLRYAHAFSADRPGPLLRVSCHGATRSSDLLDQIAAATSDARTTQPGASALARRGIVAVWLDDVDALSIALQRRIVDWIEHGLPAGFSEPFGGARIRWVASCRTLAVDTPEALDTLDSSLARTLCGMQLTTVPLRQRLSAIEPFVADTARAWGATRNVAVPDFEPEALALLRGDPWPGNLADLEAVVMRTLAHLDPGAEIVRAADLRFLEGPALPVAPAPVELRGPASTPSTPSSRSIAPPAAAAAAGPENVDPATEIETLSIPEPVDVRQPDTERADAIGSRDAGDLPPLQRLARAVAHEIRNPLVPIRTLSQLLPEHYRDEEFRTRFTNLVGDGVRRIEEVVEQLQAVAEGSGSAVEPIDVTELLESLLEGERDRIRSHRLLVLKELDRRQPHALGDRASLESALSNLVRSALEHLPDNADLYVASKHHPAVSTAATTTGGQVRGATLRVLMRYRTADSAPFRDAKLHHAVAEALIRSLGGRLSIDDTAAPETVVLLDLPAPD
jgi:DNA-binding NtrC family response regulator